MADRWCDKCGAKASPRIPRTRVGNEMWCAMCTQNHGRQRMAGLEHDLHPDIRWKRGNFGVSNTSLGRAGFAMHRTGGITTHPFHDPEGWKIGNSSFAPVRSAIEGARAFASEKGLRDPHEHDFARVMQTKERTEQIGRHYSQMAAHNPDAIPHFESMRHEVNQQHDFATRKMGIKFETVDHDPYANVHEMVHDVQNNKRLKVMGTHVTGGHPFFTNAENDKFRGVHDLFGHAATGRDFSRHGEEAAFQAHSLMFSHHARPAMAAETRGQNTALILHGDFQDQKINVLPEHMHSDHSIDFQRRSTLAQVVRWGDLGKLRTTAGMVRVAHDSGDGETIFHCPFCGSGQVIARSDGTVECEFCTTAFTVQVQPQMPSFPQTIDGVPVDVPGMPAGGQNANVPPGAAPGADPLADPGADPADAAAGGEFPPGDDADDDEQDEGDDKPAFLKGSYRTHTGAVLDGEKYMRHLALAHARDRGAVLEQIRAENGEN